MANQLRRLTSTLLLLALLLSMLPVTAFGVEAEDAAVETAENTDTAEAETESSDITAEQETAETTESDTLPTEEAGEQETLPESSDDAEADDGETSETGEEPATDASTAEEMTVEETAAEETAAEEAAEADEVAVEASGETYYLTLEYDDRWSLSDDASDDLSGYTISSITTETVTSYQVSGGKKTSTLDTDVVTADGEDGLIATGVGTATVTLLNKSSGKQATLSVTVEPATLTVLLIAGQSNAEGSSTSTTGAHPEDSVLCEEGQVYSTYAPSVNTAAKLNSGISKLKACTESTASAYVAASLTGSVSLAGTKLVYPLNALTESGNGKTGMDSGLAYQWNSLTGDKVWTVNAAAVNSSITTWVPGGTYYERALAVFQYAQTTAAAEIASGHYTRGHTLLFWLQGEADKTMSVSDYLSYFSQMRKGFRSEGIGIEYYGLITVRAANGHTTSDDLTMTGPRTAQYLMGNSTSYSNVYVVSNVNEQWVTDSGVKSYFRSVYGSALTYPLRENTTLSGLPTTVSEVHSDVHYSQVAHNENGLTAAQMMYSIVYGTGSTSVSVCWYNESGTALSTGATVSLTKGNTYSYVPVVTPLSQSKRVSVSYSSSAISYNSTTGALTASAIGTGTLTATAGKTSAVLTVTVKKAAPLLSSISVSSSGIVIKWGSVSGASKYRVYRKTGSSGSWTKLADTTSTSYTDRTAVAGKTYYYTARCIYSDGTYSGYDATGLGLKYAATPSLSSVTGGTSGVTVKWASATGAVKYRVYRKTGSSGSWTKLADTTSTSYKDSTAVAGKTYYYTVRCVNSSGSAFTSAYDTTGLSIKYAATPTLSSVTGGTSGVTVKWASATGAVKYRVYRKTGSSGSWTRLANTTSTSYTDRTAVAGKTYYYTVRCINSDGTQLTSGYDTTGLKIKYAAAPTLSSVNAYNSGITVTWRAATGAVKYRVYRKTGSSGSWTRLAVTTSTSYTDSTAVAGKTYSYTVRCISSDGTQFTSGYDTTGLKIKYAATPTLSSVKNTSSGVKITWAASTGAVNYRVYRKTGSNGSWTRLAVTTSTSYTDSTAVAGKTYYYTVRCVSSDGTQFTSGYNTTGLYIRAK